MPLVIMVVSFSFWAIVALVKRTTYYLKNQLVTTIIVLLFLVHPKIV